MDIHAINHVTALPAEAPAIPAAEAVEKREVIQAVKALNAAEMFGQDNELTFQMDPRTQKMLIKVVNRRTRELVSQVPPEYILRLAENLRPG